MEKFLKDFLDHKNNLDEIERRGDESYGIEFMRLREFSQNIKNENQYSTTEGEKPTNMPKNRYKDILPFDYCRVKLKQKSDETDYINASFIKSTSGQNYIAAQGPLPKTVDDFWAMIWDYEVSVVVMACQEMEGIPPKLKCQRYWNISKEEDLKFGPLSIKMLEEVPVPEAEDTIICRKLLATDGNTKRTITHLHYTKWPDKFIPKCIDSILKLITTMRDIHPVERSEPLVVHCSAGCGRTGTILAIDYVKSLLENGKITEKFSLYDIIVEMRKQRMAIVQTQEQYQYVHEAVAKLFREKLVTIDDHLYHNRNSLNGDGTEYEIPTIREVCQRPTIPKIVVLPGPQIAKISSTSTQQKSRTPPPDVNDSSDNTYENYKVQTRGLNNKKNHTLNKTGSCNLQNSLESSTYYSTVKRDDILNSDCTEYSYPTFQPKVPPKTPASQIVLSQKLPTGDYFYKGVNIGFPIRLKKPKGPRPFRSL